MCMKEEYLPFTVKCYNEVKWKSAIYCIIKKSIVHSPENIIINKTLYFRLCKPVAYIIEHGVIFHLQFQYCNKEAIKA